MSKTYNRTHVEDLITVSEIITSYYFEPIDEVDYHGKCYDFWQIFYVVGGERVMYINSAAYHIKAGQVIFNPPNTLHHPGKGLTEEPCNVGIISFTCNSAVMDFFKGKTVTLFGEEQATLLDLIKTGARLFETIKDDSPFCGLKPRRGVHPLAFQFVKVSLERFLILLYSRYNNIDLIVSEQSKVNRLNQEIQIVSDIKRYMTENIKEPLTIEIIGRHFGINPVTLKKLFKRETGNSIIDYFCNQKIKTAKSLIDHTTMNFTQIAEELGFSSSNYFSKFFKNRTGLSPSEYSRLTTKRKAF